jgi:hypothetical protein
MNYRVVIRTTDLFVRKAKKLNKKYSSFKSDLKNLQEELLKNPELGESLGSGLRKVRLAIRSKQKGKSGGARVITYADVIVKTDTIELFLITIYDKSETASIDKNRLQNMVKTIFDKG